LDENFWSEEKRGYFTAAKDEAGLITRKIDRNDGAIPSPNSIAFGNLIRLSQYFVEPELDDRAAELFVAHGDVPEKYPLGLPSLLLGLYLRQGGGPRLLVLSGANSSQRTQLLGQLGGRFIPDLLVACVDGTSPQGIPVLEGKTATEPMAYLCEDGTCQPPLKANEVIGSIR
jgi:uncharacterized protein YyaL (SSP411 family)